MQQIGAIARFSDPEVTAKGQQRAWVDFDELKTLWFNTGTLCNLTCAHCYIESSPTNDRLSFLTLGDVIPYLDELDQLLDRPIEIGLTGGEPLINPHIIEIMEACLLRQHQVLVLTNAFNVIGRHKQALMDLNQRFGHNLCLRVSLDYYDAVHHDEERGAGRFAATLKAIKWCSDQGFNLGVAGRSRWGESLCKEREGYQKLFRDQGISIDTESARHFVIFPEMDTSADVPEITTACWDILGKDPRHIMCASSRMVVKPKRDGKTTVQACTLLPHEHQFNVGDHLTNMKKRVSLNHVHCAKFCVLGGASCSG